MNSLPLAPPGKPTSVTVYVWPMAALTYYAGRVHNWNRGSDPQIPNISHLANSWSREGDGTPLHYSCPENPMDGGAWWAAVHGVTKSRTRLSDFIFKHWRRNGNPLQCSCLEDPRDGRAWWAAVCGVAQGRTLLKWLSTSSSISNSWSSCLFPITVLIWL